jgi:hypothetical protein
MVSESEFFSASANPSCGVVHPPSVLCPVRPPCRTTSRLLPSVLSSRPSLRRPRMLRRRPPPLPGRPPPPRGGVQGHRLGADGYSCPPVRVIFVFLVIFPSHGLAARPHHLFDQRRHGCRRTSPSGDHSAQRPPPTTPAGVISWSRLYSATA